VGSDQSHNAAFFCPFEHHFIPDVLPQPGQHNATEPCGCSIFTNLSRQHLRWAAIADTFRYAYQIPAIVVTPEGALFAFAQAFMHLAAETPVEGKNLSLPHSVCDPVMDLCAEGKG